MKKKEILNKIIIFFSLYTVVMIAALIKSTGLTERITNVNFHPLINLNRKISILYNQLIQYTQVQDQQKNQQ
jgi:hypothetical protein